MEKKVKNIGFKIPDNEAQKIEEIYPSLNFGAQRAVRSWVALRQSTLRGLKGIFSDKELEYVSKLISNINFEPSLAHSPEILITIIKDAIEFEKPNQKTKVDGKSLIKKISSLKPAEIFFLQEAIQLTSETDKTAVPLLF
jgi:hypothetical protein